MNRLNIPVQYLEHTYTKIYMLFIWNATVTRCPVFLFVKPGNPYPCS